MPEIALPASFDDFMKDVPKEDPKNDQMPDSPGSETMEARFAKERIEWSAKIENLSKQMKNIVNMSDLMTIVYTERQRAVEYHSYLISLLQKITRTYRKQHAERYDFYSYKSQVRYPNERSKEIRILADLEVIVAKRETLDNHAKFIDKSISTIDNIIFGIKSRIEVEQIMRGK